MGQESAIESETHVIIPVSMEPALTHYKRLYENVLVNMGPLAHEQWALIQENRECAEQTREERYYYSTSIRHCIQNWQVGLFVLLALVALSLLLILFMMMSGSMISDARDYSFVVLACLGFMITIVSGTLVFVENRQK